MTKIKYPLDIELTVEDIVDQLIRELGYKALRNIIFEIEEGAANMDFTYSIKKRIDEIIAKEG